ncbi:DUF4190 domain-containing protein [Actinomadura sp. WMMB 499]|uniref:DUF4190 domain-containing protein n=1 Tax=Actinomadura sp. WMMB 499 TaxID=1219491 RepID=UPI001243D533|nr:DUF4190 domain-containing protein [Actinomadura sp. WMMB 499]QFG25691.1 hypothetical protein F7P10_35650 [Actinomadura sp. WMMB 499]
MTTPPDADDIGRNRPWAPPDAVPATPPEAPDGAAPGAPEPPSPEPPRRMDRTAVIALVTGLLGLVPVALGFAVASLVRLRRGTQRGRALAVAALAASLTWTVAGTLVAVLSASGSSLERNESGTITVAGEAPFAELQEGDCFTGYDPMTPVEELGTVLAVPCTTPHTGEIIARIPLPDDAIPDTPDVLCTGRYTYLRKSRAHERLEPYFGVPAAGRGQGRERWIVCAQHLPEGELRTPLAATVDHSLKTYEQLTPGTCVRSWTLERPIVTSVVPCGEPHWNEVFATYEISLDGTYAPGSLPPYPFGEVLYPEALGRCSAEAGSLFRKVPPKPGLEIDAVLPHQAEWSIGILTVLCTVRATGEGMQGSIMPG